MASLESGTSLRTLAIALILGSVLALHQSRLAAQDYPAKPVRIVVPNAAGSLNDTLARLVFSSVSEALGQQFIVDDRPGAGGIIGAEAVAKSPPDGYTLLATAHTVMVVNPYLYTKLTYDPLRDFAPIAMLAKVSEVLTVNPALGAKTLAEFIALAKARPGKITYASGGNGHPTHLMMELFQRTVGIQLVHVPYRGTTPAMQAIVAGQVDAYNIGIGLARPHILSGKVIALAKTGLPAKDALPGVPALTESFPDAEYIPWQGAFAPKGTPEAIVAKLNAAIGSALESPDIRKRMTEVDLTPVGGSSDDLDRAVRAELILNRDLVKSIGLKLD